MHEGYPVDFMGMNDAAFVAIGATAAQRRDSRLAIWKKFGPLGKISLDEPERVKDKTVRVAYRGETLTDGVGVLVRSGGKMKVAMVALDGQAMKPSETDGYYTYQDNCSTTVVVAMPRVKTGSYTIKIKFE